MSERPNCLVVGVGRIGELHARVIARDPRVRLGGIVDTDARRARAVATQLGTTAYSSVEGATSTQNFTAVVVAVPEQFRLSSVMALNASTKYVLLEKPLGTDLAQARELADHLIDRGIRASVNYILRADVRYQALQRAAECGDFGRLATILATRRGTAAGADLLRSWTGLLRSTGIHDLDVMRWIANSPVAHVYAEADPLNTSEDAAAILIRFESGALGILETSWVLPSSVPAPLEESLEVVGTGGMGSLRGSSMGVSVVDRQGVRLPDLVHWPTDVYGEVVGAFKRSVTAFIDTVTDGREPIMTVDDALVSEAIVDAALRSIKSGKRERLL